MKVCVVGIGHVGSTVAYTLLVDESVRELVLVSRDQRRVEGEVLDLQHASNFLDTPANVTAGDLHTGGCDIVVLTVSGKQATAKRSSLAKENADIFRAIVPPLATANPSAIIVVVSNPVEALTQLTMQLTGFDPARVLGTGTLIDSLRFRSALSRHLGIHPDDVRAYVIGEHGDFQFPLLSSASTGGVRLLPDDVPAEAIESTTQSGQMVFERRGYTNFAISQAVAMIVRSIAFDQRRTLPISTMVANVGGFAEVCLSVPCVVGRRGVLRKLLPKLDDNERTQFEACAREVAEVYASMR